MAKRRWVLGRMQRNPADVRYDDLLQVCEEHFGPPRQNGTAHAVFKTSWAGNPRVNIQSKNGKAKAYQARQVLQAIDKLEGERSG